jgi:hypothetical protein
MNDVERRPVQERIVFPKQWRARSGSTLQEMFAPPNVMLTAKYWSLIGDRDDEAGSIEEVTNILKFSKEFDLQIFATATKISWAANRKSTKVEDPPCPPFKPFGINMPTIYEAEKAF